MDLQRHPRVSYLKPRVPISGTSADGAGTLGIAARMSFAAGAASDRAAPWVSSVVR